MVSGTPVPDDEGPVYRFGHAELDLAAHELRIEGKRAPLGARGIGLLRMLVERRRGAVSKHELLDIVWKGVIVEENNLQVQISTLRRMLGPNAIATIPGRGYRFMLPVDGGFDEAAEVPQIAQGPPVGISAQRAEAGNVPARLPELYGRSSESDTLQLLVEQHPWCRSWVPPALARQGWAWRSRLRWRQVARTASGSSSLRR